jgi:hypothetical protein
MFAATRFGVMAGKTSASALVAATGGVISPSGAYTLHTFTAADTFASPVDLAIEYLVVGGGGGGGGTTYHGGPGGAGGFLAGSLALPAGSYPVTVGAGGAGGSASATRAAALPCTP